MGMTFNEILKIAPGQRYWENSQYGCTQFTVKDRPTVTTNSDNQKQARFIGILSTGEEVPYLLTEGLEHYGPSISLHKEYWDLNELHQEIEVSKKRDEDMGYKEECLYNQIWVTGDGKEIPVFQLCDKHLAGLIKKLENNKKHGVSGELDEDWLEVLRAEHSNRWRSL